MHSGYSRRICPGLYSIDESLLNMDLVECRHRANHGYAGNDLLRKTRLPQSLQTLIVRLKGGDRFRHELRFGALRFHVPFVLLHEEKDSELPVNHADIGFSVRVRPANEEGDVFSLTDVAIIRIVLEDGKEIGGKIINGRFFPRGNRHDLVQIEEEHSIICVLYSPRGILFVVENHSVDRWLGQNGISEESSDILGSDDNTVGGDFVYRPIRS